MAVILINNENNEYKQLLPVQGAPSPLVLSGSWQDLPANHLINCQDTTSIGLWLDVSASGGFQIRLQATYSKDSNNFFSLPIQSPTSTIVGLEYQVYEFINAGAVKLVISASVSDVLNYVKIQAKGVGNIDAAYVTFKGR
jgi:hypothetical protein